MIEAKDLVYISVLVVLSFLFFQSRLKTFLSERSKRQEQAVAANVALADELKALRVLIEEGKTIPKFLEGLEKVSLAQVGEVMKLREAVETFSSLVAAKPTGDEVSEYDPYKAQLAYIEAQYRAEGMTADNAKARAMADESSRTMYDNPTE